MSGDRYLEPEWDDDLPPVPDLDGLARYAETQAAPSAPSAVRRAGTSRRRRRHVGVVAGALALLVAAGGIAVGGTRPLTDAPPPVAASPTSAVRTVTAANLSSAAELQGALGRSLLTWVASTSTAVSTCGDPVYWTGPLRVQSFVTRTFEAALPPSPSPDPNRETVGPTVCEAAWQFASATQARDAATAYERSFTDRSLFPDDVAAAGRNGFGWTTISGTDARVAEWAYRPADYPGENDDYAIWESHGLVVDGDRIALTVYRDESGEQNTSLDPEVAARDGMPLHPQLALTEASARALVR